MDFINQIASNKALGISILAWFIAQTSKVLITLIMTRKFNFELFVSTGGMPSSHSAFVTALAVAVGKEYGWDSYLFAISVVFSMIVMYDAAGIRRAAGKQAKILNSIVKEIQINRVLNEEKLKELLGHTPFEVIGGAAVGILVSNIFL
ncbi:MAG: divergent PAP2 family protein [Clostridia bacterium]|nr:divergent PAP2 family protein [Clostridia bacterium]